MSFLVYNAGEALWAAASMAQAMELAEPYLQDQGIVRIEEQTAEEPPGIWSYDYKSAAWVELT